MPSVPVWLRICFSDAALFVWEEHFQSYWKARQLPNLLMLTFEDMQADLNQTVRTIAAFLAVELTADEFELGVREEFVCLYETAGRQICSAGAHSMVVAQSPDDPPRRQWRLG